MIKNILLISLLSAPMLAVADIYKYTDADGRTYYTLEPKAGYKKLIPKKTEKERKARRKEELRQAQKAYQDRVEATARFLDDVEAARHRH